MMNDDVANSRYDRMECFNQRNGVGIFIGSSRLKRRVPSEGVCTFSNRRSDVIWIYEVLEKVGNITADSAKMVKLGI